MDLTGATELPKPAYFPPWLGGRFLKIKGRLIFGMVLSLKPIS